MPKWASVLLIAMTLLLLAGCGSNFSAFKELGVSNKNIPQYEISSEITDQNPPTQIWSTASIKDLDENQIKQIQADYIDKKLKENGQTIKVIVLTVKGKKEQYTAQYVKDEETLRSIETETEKPAKLPAIIYSKKS